jgi:N-acyl-D-amino-acid deacylase
MSHLRSEDDDKIDAALAELVEACRKSGARAHVAHLKIVLGHGEERAKALLSKMDEARASGVDLTADLYPYTASYTGLSILFPDFARPPASYSNALKNRRADLLAALRARIEKRNGPDAMLFGTGEYAGQTLLQASRARNVPFEELLLEVGPNGGEAAYFVMDDAVVTRIFLDPFVMIGTDGSNSVRHPRGYGAFARVIEELVQKRGLVSLEEAVRKMAGLPAETLGLAGERGCVKVGCAADLLIFAPEDVKARSDFQSPHRLAAGMRFVLVNGHVEREAGRATPAHSGRALHSKWRRAPKPI